MFCNLISAISMNEEKQASINQRTIPPLLNSVCSCLIGIPPTVLLDMLLDKETVEEQLQQGANQPTAGQEGNLDDDEIERLKNVVILLIEQFKSDKSCLQVVAFALLWKYVKNILFGISNIFLPLHELIPKQLNISKNSYIKRRPLSSINLKHVVVVGLR